MTKNNVIQFPSAKIGQHVNMVTFVEESDGFYAATVRIYPIPEKHADDLAETMREALEDYLISIGVISE